MGYDLYCVLCGCVNYNYFRVADYEDFSDIKDKFTEKDYKNLIKYVII